MNLTDEPYQYLYTEGEQVHLLNLESFEEIEMTVSQCEGSVNMLEGMYIYIYLWVYVVHSNASSFFFTCRFYARVSEFPYYS